MKFYGNAESFVVMNSGRIYCIQSPDLGFDLSYSEMIALPKGVIEIDGSDLVVDPEILEDETRSPESWWELEVGPQSPEDFMRESGVDGAMTATIAYVEATYTDEISPEGREWIARKLADHIESSL